MKFSIVVPVYNVEAYLNDCLTSLQTQNFSDFEVICVNDGSNDRSREILSEWETRIPQLKIIDRKNGGLSAARNTGLAAASGDYIIFVDSDDWVESTMLSRLDEEANGEDMICFACRKSDCGATDTLVKEQSDGWSYYNRHALEHREVPFVCVWQRCYRREFLVDNSLRFREGILHEDNEFTPRACLKAARVKVIPDVLYHYRVRPNSIMTRRGLRNKRDLILIANELSALFGKEAGIEKATVYRALTQYYQMAFLDNTDEEKGQLRQVVDWRCYHHVSRTKLRHRMNYLKNRYL